MGGLTLRIICFSEYILPPCKTMNIKTFQLILGKYTIYSDDMIVPIKSYFCNTCLMTLKWTSMHCNIDLKRTLGDPNYVFLKIETSSFEIGRIRLSI